MRMTKTECEIVDQPQGRKAYGTNDGSYRTNPNLEKPKPPMFRVGNGFTYQCPKVESVGD